jgi:hypothetical protein
LSAKFDNLASDIYDRDGGVAMAIPDEDLGPHWLRDEKSIDVQVEGLKSFSKALLEDLDKNFGTHVPQIYDVMSKHACVGDGMFFAEMDEVRNRHYECLTSIVNLLRDYASGTYAVGKGADTVAKNYTDADSLAHVKVTDVQKVMQPGTPGGTTQATSATSTPVTPTDPALTDKGVQ